MTHQPIRRVLFALLMGMVLTVSVAAQGVELKSSASVYFGSASTCTQPATINHAKVRNATPEWQTIRSEGVRKGSARYSLLISEMTARIQRACRTVAEEEGRDCVVGHRDIKEDHGLGVVDITSSVVAKLESGEVSP